MSSRLTDSLVADYLRDGIETNLARPSARSKIASSQDDPGRFFEDLCNWQDIP